MFRVEFFVDDRKLADALRSLMHISHGAPSVQPVVNAVPTGNGLAAISGGGQMERFFLELKKIKGREVKPGEVKTMMKAAGLNPTSSGYFVKNAIKAGLLSRSGKGNAVGYKVL